MPSYISAAFEKTYLPVTEQVRIIVRNLDQGNVPPAPSTMYYPTQPNELRNFAVVEYINDSLGERWSRVATVADFTTLTVRSLNVFRSITADFITAGVVAGDTLAVTFTNPAYWTSTEYPTSTPFYFTVASVIDANNLSIDRPFPAFKSNMIWTIPARAINGTDGVTRRDGSPAPGSSFLDQRFNAYFNDVVTAENFVIAVKAGMDALTNVDSLASLTNENYTAKP